MAFFTKEELRGPVLKTASFISAQDMIAESVEAGQEFDIFLSHRYEDREYILNLYHQLRRMGFSVYVDWIVDPGLDRSAVTKANAAHIRKRMKQCQSLLYAMVDMSKTSKWTTWELGFGDGYHGKVAVLPILDHQSSKLGGQEFLSLYPYIEKAKPMGDTKDTLWVYEDQEQYVRYDLWLKGQKPSKH